MQPKAATTGSAAIRNLFRLVAHRIVNLHIESRSFHNADSFFDQFIDPEDGMLDGSEFLLDYPYGILPVPIFITEPAIGNGFGLAGVYFHDPDPAWEGNLHREVGSDLAASLQVPLVSVNASPSGWAPAIGCSAANSTLLIRP